MSSFDNMLEGCTVNSVEAVFDKYLKDRIDTDTRFSTNVPSFLSDISDISVVLPKDLWLKMIKVLIVGVVGGLSFKVSRCGSSSDYYVLFVRDMHSSIVMNKYLMKSKSQLTFSLEDLKTVLKYIESLYFKGDQDFYKECCAEYVVGSALLINGAYWHLKGGGKDYRATKKEIYEHSLLFYIPSMTKALDVYLAFKGLNYTFTGSLLSKIWYADDWVVDDDFIEYFKKNKKESVGNERYLIGLSSKCNSSKAVLFIVDLLLTSDVNNIVYVKGRVLEKVLLELNSRNLLGKLSRMINDKTEEYFTENAKYLKDKKVLKMLGLGQGEIDDDFEEEFIDSDFSLSSQQVSLFNKVLRNIRKFSLSRGLLGEVVLCEKGGIIYLTANGRGYIYDNGKVRVVGVKSSKKDKEVASVFIEKTIELLCIKIPFSIKNLKFDVSENDLTEGTMVDSMDEVGAVDVILK